MHRAFSHWLSKSRRSTARRAEEVARAERRRQVTLRTAWDRWIDAFRESQLWEKVSTAPLTLYEINFRAMLSNIYVLTSDTIFRSE